MVYGICLVYHIVLVVNILLSLYWHESSKSDKTISGDQRPIEQSCGGEVRAAANDDDGPPRGRPWQRWQRLSHWIYHQRGWSLPAKPPSRDVNAIHVPTRPFAGRWDITRKTNVMLNTNALYVSGDPGAIAPQPAALVTIQPEKEGGYSRVVSVSMPEHITSHPSPSTPTSHHTYKEEGRGEEPQDLTPMQDVSNTQVSSHSSPDTPGKKERNSRKQCPYCHKDFHEMSLKRHTKDDHFRNQNTYVICPQWKGCQRKQSVTNNTGININRHCFKQSHPL